jgi:trigger factor
MNISLNKNDAISGVIKLEIEKKDYEIQVEKTLRQYRQKVDIPGFRKGMVPLGIIRKMYGRYILIEELDKIVQENLSKYIKENGIQILGNPMANEMGYDTIDLDTQEDFEFHYDIALTPAIDITLSKEDKLTYYQIEIDDALLERQIAYHRGNYGSHETVECVEASDLVKGIVTEMEDGNPKEGGIMVEDAILMPLYMKEKEEQAKFIGAKLHDVIIFNPRRAYEGTTEEFTVELASFLKVDKETASGITGDFRFEVTEITRLKEAALDQELFDKIFGEGNVKTEEEFKEKIKASLIAQFRSRSEYKLMLEAHALLIDKVKDVTFADHILKRWLLATNEQATPEMIEEDYPREIRNLKFELVKKHIIKTNNLTIGEADMILVARQMAKSQFAQYGMFQVPDKVLDDQAKRLLKNEKSLQYVVDSATDEKLITWVKQQVDVETKNVSLEVFEGLLS